MMSTAGSVDGKLATLACAALFAAAGVASHAQAPAQGPQPVPAQPPVTAAPAPAQPAARAVEYPKVSLTAGSGHDQPYRVGSDQSGPVRPRR